MSEYSIGLSTAGEIEGLPEIERRAARLFPPEVVDPTLAEDTTPIAEFVRAQREARLLVARTAEARVVGFAHLDWVGGVAHLEELDVDPEHGRRGIGRRLVEAACDWARAQGCSHITLTTFRDVPWNAPFYARLGFVALREEELCDALRELRAAEAQDGLDPHKRIVMQRDLGREVPIRSS